MVVDHDRVTAAGTPARSADRHADVDLARFAAEPQLEGTAPPTCTAAATHALREDAMGRIGIRKVDTAGGPARSRRDERAGRDRPRVDHRHGPATASATAAAADGDRQGPDLTSARLAGEREASVATPSADALSDDAGGVLAVHEDASVIGHGHGTARGALSPRASHGHRYPGLATQAAGEAVVSAAASIADALREDPRRTWSERGDRGRVLHLDGGPGTGRAAGAADADTDPSHRTRVGIDRVAGVSAAPADALGGDARGFPTMCGDGRAGRAGLDNVHRECGAATASSPPTLAPKLPTWPAVTVTA